MLWGDALSDPQFLGRVLLYAVLVLLAYMGYRWQHNVTAFDRATQQRRNAVTADPETMALPFRAAYLVADQRDDADEQPAVSALPGVSERNVRLDLVDRDAWLRRVDPDREQARGRR